MFSKFRSLIFKLDPETAHNLAIKSLKLNLTPNLIDDDKDDLMFKSTLFGKEINNPIGMAAGFDKNAEVYNALFKLGFGFVEVGTVTPFKQYGNPKPRVFRLVEDQALINRLGFNNLGAEDVSNRIRSNLNKGLLGINIGPNKDSNNRLNDYLIGLRTFHDIADYITINISSPNTENLRIFHDEEKFDELMNSIQEEKVKLNINLFNLLVFNILRKEQFNYGKKEHNIHFSMEKSTIILEKIFSTTTFSPEKVNTCIFMFEQFNLHDITTIKYSILCETFVKKLKKYSNTHIFDLKKVIENKIYSHETYDKINNISELKFINWLLSP